MLSSGVKVRYEYQARKSLHWHMAARMLGLSMEDLVTACKKYDFDVKLSSEEEQEMTEQETADYNRMMCRGAVTDHPHTEEFESHVQSCRDRVVDFTAMDLGLSAVHPQSDPKCWPALYHQGGWGCFRLCSLQVWISDDPDWLQTEAY